jgi:uncharacterized membrane protein (UPF0127 family)
MDIHYARTPLGMLKVKLATRFGARLVGLLGSPGLSSDEALLLHPCRSIHTFGMRFAIDAVFLDADGRLLAARRNLTPWRWAVAPPGAVMTLELAAGRLPTAALPESDWSGLALLVSRRNV